MGRDRELDTLGAALSSGCGITTVVGPPGAGKTALALAIAGAWSGEVMFCDASGARTGPAIVDAVLRTTGCPTARHARDELDHVGRTMATCPEALWLLDGIELDSPAVWQALSRWSSVAPSARILLTTRGWAGFEEDRTVGVGGLDPDAAEVVVRSWCESAHLSDASVAAVVEATGGVPLALQMLGGLCDVLPLEVAAHQITRSLGDTAEAGRSAHRTGTGTSALLDAVAATVWSHLPGSSREAIAKLSVCVGAVDPASAAAIAGGSREVEDLLRRGLLLAASPRRGAAPAGGSFRLHPVLRARATAHLRTTGGAAAAAQAHARHYLAVAEGHTAALSTARVLEAAAGLRAAGPELEAVAHRFSTTDPLIARRAALALDAGLEYGGTLHARAAILDRALLAVGPNPELLRRRAQVHRALTGPVAARRALDQALDVARRSGDDAGWAHAVLDIADLDRRAGRTDDAIVGFRRSLELFRKMGDGRMAGRALVGLGLPLWIAGETREALDAYEQGLALLRAAGDVRQEAIGRSNFANRLREAGDHERARQEYDRALAVHVALGDRRLQGHVYLNLGTLHRDLGRLGEARLLYRQALDLTRAVGDYVVETEIEANLAGLHHEVGDLTTAEALYRAVLARPGQERRLRAIYQGNLGILSRDAGDLLAAEQHLARAAAELRAVDDAWLVSVFDSHRAACLAERGDLEAASRVWDAAQQHAATTGAGALEAAFLSDRATGQACAGDWQGAADAVERARILAERFPGDPRVRALIHGRGAAILAVAGRPYLSALADATAGLVEVGSECVALHGLRVYDAIIAAATGRDVAWAEQTLAEVTAPAPAAPGSSAEPPLVAVSAEVRLAARLLAQVLGVHAGGGQRIAIG